MAGLKSPRWPAGRKGLRLLAAPSLFQTFRRSGNELLNKYVTKRRMQSGAHGAAPAGQRCVCRRENVAALGKTPTTPGTFLKPGWEGGEAGTGRGEPREARRAGGRALRGPGRETAGARARRAQGARGRNARGETAPQGPRGPFTLCGGGQTPCSHRVEVAGRPRGHSPGGAGHLAGLRARGSQCL